jgi:hypothetical protein
MITLLVGGDRIKTYSDYLQANGLGPVLHWNGRKRSECHRAIPLHTRLVVILVDQVNHGLATKTRRMAGQRDLPIVYSPRSLSHLDEVIGRFRRAIGRPSH